MPATNWTPPEELDPFQIHQEAVEDTRAGRHSDALAKFLWFHDHALEFNQGQYGVRLSFALSDWLDLANRYPPARAAMIYKRDEAEALAREQPHNFHIFHEAAAFNEKLGEPLRTADLFTAIAQQDFAAASRLHHVAQQYLIAAGRCRECGPFLNPTRELELAAELYHLNLEFEDSRSRTEQLSPPPLAKKHYVARIANLVALLTHNDRQDEAHQVRASALLVLDEPEFRTALDNALSGHFPDSE